MRLYWIPLIVLLAVFALVAFFVYCIGALFALTARAAGVDEAEVEPVLLALAVGLFLIALGLLWGAVFWLLVGFGLISIALASRLDTLRRR